MEENNRKKKNLKKIKSSFDRLIKKSYELPLWKWLIVCFLLSVLEVVLLEVLGRRSMLTPFVFILHNPLVFLYNILIVYTTLSFALLFKRRGFVIGLILLLWLGVGTINFVLLGYRITPFSAIDFLMFSDVLSMFNIYFNFPQRIAIIIGVITFVIIIVIAFLKIPKIKGKVNYAQGLIVFSICFILTFSMTFVALESSLISDKFTNLGTAYKNYGFVYCFSNSVIDQGIGKPDNYSKNIIDSYCGTAVDNGKTVSKLATYKYKNGRKIMPHIIAIQLESFIDISRVKGINTDINPIPNYSKFRDEYPSGYLTVPAIGAGTANTEFEILTGMKSKLFGAGEYPYKTVLTEVPCESMAQILLRYGYGTHAIHNNKAKFYSRDVSYANLGFETFTSLEYMLHFEKTQTGWAKDNCLPDEIMNAIDYDDKSDFVFTISVQGHGRYPKNELKTKEYVHVTLDSGDPELTNQFGYFVNQCYEMDMMIGELKDRLDARGEPYVLLLYGDHIPSLTFEEDQFEVGTESQTEYVIISNFYTGLKDTDLYSYEMSDYLLRGLGIVPGIMQDIHYLYNDDKDIAENETFNKAVSELQYDMLYGDRYVYDYVEPYQKTDIRLGLFDIEITDVEYNESTGSIVVRGNNFTTFSNVLINDQRVNTTYIDDHTIMIIPTEVEKPPEVGDVFVVAQIDKDKHELSRTPELVYGEEK